MNICVILPPTQSCNKMVWFTVDNILYPSMLWQCVILWFIIRNIWTSSRFWHSSKNPWNFLSVESAKDVFCYVNEVTIWMPLSYLRMGGLLQGEPTMWSEGWTFQSHLPDQMANDLINSAYKMNSLLKTPKDRVWRASRLGNAWTFGENGA